MNLKPCPFCGSLDLKVTPIAGQIAGSYILCLKCGCNGPYKEHVSDAIEAWNKREANR